jgi:hypothetical protein
VLQLHQQKPNHIVPRAACDVAAAAAAPASRASLSPQLAPVTYPAASCRGGSSQARRRTCDGVT